MDAIIPPHPTRANNVAQRRAASVQEHSINVASTSSASVHGRYYPTPPHPPHPRNHVLSMCGDHENRNAYTVVEIRVTKNMKIHFMCHPRNRKWVTVVHSSHK